MRKLLMFFVAVFGLAGLVTVASAHMMGGGYQGRMGYGQGYGWNCGGMGMGGMHSGMGPGWMHGSGYNCNGPAGSPSASASSMKLLPQDELQKRVEAFAGKSFPGYQVGKMEKNGYGQGFYSVLLTGNDSRFEVQVNAVDGRITGIFPVQE